MDALVLTVSMSLQFLAAAWALSLTRLTGRSSAWTCLAAAIGLMGVRRAITLTRLMAGSDTMAVDLAAELVALLISVLMVLGIGCIGPLVKRLQRTEEILCLNEQLRQEAEERREAQEALQHEQRTLNRLLRASDHERRLIGYDIHDGLAQQLAGALMQLQVYEAKRHEAPSEAEGPYRAAVDAVRQAHSEARRLISGVRPPVLDESGIEAALASLVEDTGPPAGPKIELQYEVRFDRLPEVLENAIYRMVQQMLSNACQHSHTERVTVALVQHGTLLRLEVRDWGIGFDPNAVPDNRFGLEGLRERTRLLGGEMTIESESGKGTCVRIELPLADMSADFSGDRA